ncbi:DedA family protein [Glutamicibacter protophormiae]|uniref:DedA family protein n=1 Tax=Glutamicibacter protophormiae TaxID=37930 RepID=UPI003BAF9C84
MSETIAWLIDGAPYAITFAFFFCLAFARGNATYWMGRGIAKGVEHTRFERHLHGPAYLRAQRFIARWGMLAVPLSFLTVGIQSAVNASAGVSRMPVRRYLPAVAVGAIAWALLYTTIGMAVFYAWLALDWPWLVGGALVIALAAAVTIRMRKRRSAYDTPQDIPPH